MKTVSPLIWFVCIAGFMCSCDANRLYENNISFNNEIWHKDSVIAFDVNIPSGQVAYNIFVNCRINGQYNYSNLFLFIETTLPDSSVKRDTLECMLAKPSGEWLGSGFGNIWSYQIPYKGYVRFPEKGLYKFRLQQAMRETELKHILDAGIRVEEFRK